MSCVWAARRVMSASAFTGNKEMGSEGKETFSMKILKKLCCESCNLQFYIKDLTLKGSRCPMLLHCGHSICESCIQKSPKGAKVITCQQCGSTTSLQSAEQSSKCFPLNLYLMGSILAIQNFKLERNKIKFSSLTKSSRNFNYVVKGESESPSYPNQTNCEECLLPALWYCENCRSNFCEICWTKIHGSAKSLKKHQKSEIRNVEVEKLDLKKCLQHENQNLEFFCRGCSTTVCSHCVILHHQGEGHFPITLKDKNMEMINNVKTAAEEAEKVCKRMRQTLERVKLTQNSFDATDDLFSDLESQIIRNFSRIHGILQLEEDRLLKKLHGNWNGHENRLQVLQLQLEKQVECVEGLLKEYEFASKRLQCCDLTDLHEKLKEVQNLPCYFISRDPRNEKIKLAFDEKLIESLPFICTLDLPADEIFELRSSFNLPKDYAVEPLETLNFDQSLVFGPKGVSEFIASDTLSNSSSRDLARRDVELSPPKLPNDAMVFFDRKSRSVYVTYIKDPGEFYVTLISQRSKQKTIDSRAFQLASLSSDFPKKVAKDEIYLVKHTTDNKWYRARVKEVFPPGETGEEERVSVYFLDYGNSQTVLVSRLRSIPPHSTDMLVPPLATKCKLFDCVPKNGEWCSESTKTMEKILNGSSATMYVMKANRDILEVDLSVIYPEGQIGRDIVSVRDALLFLEFSSFVQGFKVPRHANSLKYLHQSLPPVGETFDIIITHVNSPSDFFIQRVGQDTSYWYKLTVDLQNYCSENSESSFVYNPTIGMPCAALFSADGRWYRAKIVDIPGKKMVTVLYVDYGNEETVPWSRIRKLKENFVKRPPLAFNCSLAGILPADDSWGNQAKSYLDECVMMKDCSIYINGRFKYKPKLKVFLYKQMDGSEICVNTLFVDVGYAIKPNSNRLWKVETGKVKGKKEKKTFRENFAEKKTSSEDEGCRTTSDAGNEDLREIRTFRHLSGSKLSARKLRELHASQKQKTVEGSSSDGSVDDCDKVLKVKVEVLSAESPSSVYVTFPALTEGFETLQKKMNEFYENSQPVAVEWTEGSVCAAFVSAKSSWYRASILCRLSYDRVKVFLKDVAEVSSEPVSALRKLDPSFAEYGTRAFKCHLADVEPPGENWPSVSCEYLLNELEKCKDVYITKTVQIENQSLPVEIWIQKIEPRGALEPSNKEWITLNRLLVDQGLAVPKKQKICVVGVPSKNVEDSKTLNEWESERGEEIELLSCTKVVKEKKVSEAFVLSPEAHWVPPEPLKKSRFLGTPTYVDFNAHVHMYDTEEDEKKLLMIRQVLLEEYENSKSSSGDHLWSPGEMCIARYHLDNFWYRGVVLRANENATCEVLFVDYGNVDSCPLSDLRKTIKMLEIPILSRKFQMQGIAPVSENGEWPVPVIDVLHSFVVDKKCEVHVLKAPENPEEPHLCTIKVVENDVQVELLLVDQGLASFTCFASDKSDESSFELASPGRELLVSSEPEEDSECPRGYSPFRFPDDCSGFFVEITAVNSETEFSAKIADHPEISAEFKNILNEFQSLQKIFNEESQFQPTLEKLSKGQPCCCLHRKNKNWCRGEIESFNKNRSSVSVFYVDYGKKEVHTKSSIFRCKSEWLSFPKMALKLRLANVKKCSNVPKSVYMKALTGCLKQGVLFAEILQKHEKYVQVRLLTERNGTLAYQEMLDKKLMAFVVK